MLCTVNCTVLYRNKQRRGVASARAGVRAAASISSTGCKVRTQESGDLLIIFDHIVFVEHSDNPAAENCRCPTSSSFAGGVRFKIAMKSH